MKKKKTPGFTLIELLVVVLIIGLLAAVALPQYRLAVLRARYASFMTLGRALKDAQERYFMSNGQYTDDFASLDVEMPGGWTKSTSAGDGVGLSWPDGTDCFIMLQDLKYISCRNLPRVGAAYVAYLQNNAMSYWRNIRTCFAYDPDENSLSSQLCKSLGGSKISSYSNGVNYRLP